MTKVSVIIPTYNCAKYVCEAIDSVMSQTYQDFEIIIVDDGSTDNTKQQLKNYLNDYRIGYYYQCNKGPSAARNVGLTYSKGEFVKFLDADDLLYPQQLEIQVRNLSENHSDISITNYEFLYLDKKRKICEIEINTSEQLKFLIQGNLGPIHSFMVRKNAIIAVGGFDKDMVCFEDYDLWVRLMINGAQISKSNYIGCGYRIFDDSNSASPDKMFFYECMFSEKINLLLNKPQFFSGGVAKELLWKNIMLFHRCIIRKYAFEKNLPNTSKMTKNILLSEKRGLKLLLFNLLKLKNYMYVHYLKYCMANSCYKKIIIGKELSWRNNVN